MANRLISFISPPPSRSGDLVPRPMHLSPAPALLHEWRMTRGTIRGPPIHRQAATLSYRILRRRSDEAEPSGRVVSTNLDTAQDVAAI